MHSPKMQHQKYIAPKTKQQCTKDALHNSHHRTNEAPPKMPMHSITKVHTHKTKDTMHRRCRCKEILQPKYNSPKFQRTNDSAHQRCQCIAYQKCIYIAPKMQRTEYCKMDIFHQRCSTTKVQHTKDSEHHRCIA